MNNHIVRVNEKIERIAQIYNLTVEEIKKINTHIRDWNNLIPGTKIRLPEISEEINSEIDNVEPFIEEYYPRIKEELNEKVDIIYEEPIVNNKPQNISKKKTYPPYMYNYQYYNNYPYNQYPKITNRNRKKTK